MATAEQFAQTITTGYTFKGEHAALGAAIFNGVVQPQCIVNLPLKTMNRHGLIAGATGTGKTKTLQVISEILSNNSVPVLLMDIKGDLSGIAAEGTASTRLQERCTLLNIDYKPAAYPVEFLTLSNEPGAKLRATVLEFGPILLSKILGLNDTQGGLLSILFKYCDDNALLLLDLNDLIKILQYAGEEGKATIEKQYGKISTTSLGTILRKVIELQQQGADVFFGEPSFDGDDLMRISQDGKGMVNILRVTDMQAKPKLFSTFMLQLLAELYATCPEEGDLEKPKLVLFIDEAHLLFNEASEALLDQLETVIKLIRSKGIGIFFCTQNPQDIPANILGQLGLKVQHALRAFTAADRKTIKQAAENFPISEFYTTDELLTQMGIGEAFITLLNEKGVPTPLVHTMLYPPTSRMDILAPAEIDALLAKSKLVKKYNVSINTDSAYEVLERKIATQAQVQSEEETAAPAKKAEKEESFLDNPMVKQAGRTAAAILTRTLLGALGLSGTSKRKKTGWFS